MINFQSQKSQIYVMHASPKAQKNVQSKLVDVEFTNKKKKKKKF